MYTLTRKPQIVRSEGSLLLEQALGVVRTLPFSVSKLLLPFWPLSERVPSVVPRKRPMYGVSRRKDYQNNGFSTAIASRP